MATFNKNTVNIFMLIFKNKNSKTGIKKINYGFHHLNTTSINIIFYRISSNPFFYKICHKPSF